VEGEYWGSEGSHEMFFDKPSLRRQRVRARRRPECKTAEQAQITTDEARDIEKWPKGWRPWFATPEGERR
jgi:hypothetical protein